MGLGGAPSAWEDYEWVDLRALPASPAPVVASAPAPSPPPATAPATARGRAQRQRPARGGRRSGVSDAGVRQLLDPSGADLLDEPVVPARAVDDPVAAAMSALLVERPLWVDAPGLKILLVDLDNLRAGPARWRARMAAVLTLARQADRTHMAGQVGAVRRARPYLAEFAGAAVGVADGSDVADHALLDAAAADLAAADGPVQVLVVSNDGIFADLAASGPLIVLSPGVSALSDRLDDAATDVLDLAALETDVAASARAPRS